MLKLRLQFGWSILAKPTGQATSHILMDQLVSCSDDIELVNPVALLTFMFKVQAPSVLHPEISVCQLFVGHADTLNYDRRHLHTGRHYRHLIPLH